MHSLRMCVERGLLLISENPVDDFGNEIVWNNSMVKNEKKGILWQTNFKGYRFNNCLPLGCVHFELSSFMCVSLQCIHQNDGVLIEMGK